MREDGGGVERGGAVANSSLDEAGTKVPPHMAHLPVLVAVVLPQKGHTMETERTITWEPALWPRRGSGATPNGKKT